MRTESDRIYREQEKQEDRFKMEMSTIPTPMPSEPIESIERRREEHTREVTALGLAREAVRQAESDHWQYDCIGHALSDARVGLSLRLVTYEYRLHSYPGFLTPKQESDYTYIKGVLDPLIEALKCSRAANDEAGSVTGKVVAEAKEKLKELLPY